MQLCVPSGDTSPPTFADCPAHMQQHARASDDVERGKITEQDPRGLPAAFMHSFSTGEGRNSCCLCNFWTRRQRKWKRSKVHLWPSPPLKPNAHMSRVSWDDTFHGCHKDKTLPSISCERGLYRVGSEKRWSKLLVKAWKWICCLWGVYRNINNLFFCFSLVFFGYPPKVQMMDLQRLNLVRDFDSISKE